MGDLLAPNAGPAQLRALLAGDALIVAPGAYDALSARLIEQSGFDVVYMTGYGASASLLGRPDIGLLSFAEMADQARRLVQAVTVPVIADADTGYGNPINVIRTVREYAAAGVAALHLEDQAIPKRCGHMSGKQVIAKEAMVEKIRAAAEARGSSELVLIARSDARAGEGLERAIERVASYRDAGADVIFIDALRSEEEIVAFGEALPETPKVINWVEGGLTPLIDPGVLRDLNYRIVFCSLVALLAATHAIGERLAALRNIAAPQPVPPLAFDAFNDLIAMADVAELERRFAHSDDA
ncbi:MAG TPA: isocitrate lyase/PEP mutase family protein [Solirubrobacteraceae bacterium]|nr:isocitrate lyase/PEP mutase family protein [Solirubrobacteraceae bacterium]